MSSNRIHPAPLNLFIQSPRIIFPVDSFLARLSARQNRVPAPQAFISKLSIT